MCLSIGKSGYSRQAQGTPLFSALSNPSALPYLSPLWPGHDNPLLPLLARTGYPSLSLLPSPSPTHSSPQPGQGYPTPYLPRIGILFLPPCLHWTGSRWLCGTGSMPLAFTQEDFLVGKFFWRVSFCLKTVVELSKSILVSIK